LKRGRFITFEGGEGAGKSTQIERLKDRLAGAGVEVVATREPGGSPKAELIRTRLLEGAAKRLGPAAEAVLFSAARLDHLKTVIRPALSAGRYVLCDRFFDSTRAYQGLDDRVPAAMLDALERVVSDGIRPDLTILLDVPPDIGLSRAAARRQAREATPDRFEAEALDYHERLRQAFLAIVARDPERCIVIDAAPDSDAVAQRIWEAVERRFGNEFGNELAPAREPIAGHGG
jgi:dTMP kinase